ncbi:hypothetical protein [Picosynechococcus sp. NKBG042902]|uniref:hypothetical protein n=1 Tax=Picosynechococcus sp. NKBG042902 TaxID=490193 RepID=UPI0037CA54C3
MLAHGNKIGDQNSFLAEAIASPIKVTLDELLYQSQMFQPQKSPQGASLRNLWQ